MSKQSLPRALSPARPDRAARRKCLPLLAGLLCTASLTALPAAQAAPATPTCTTGSRMLDGQITRPAGATRVCSGRTFTAYAREIVRYQSLGVRIEIWSTKGDPQAVKGPLVKGMTALGYRLKGTYPNGEQKYVTATGRGVRISDWKEGSVTYFLLFLF